VVSLPFAIPWPALARRLRVDDDALIDLNGRTTMRLGVISVTLLSAFVISHLLAGRYAMAVTVAVAQLVLLVNIVALLRGREQPVPPLLGGVGLIGAVCVSIVLQGVNGLPWTLPTLFIVFFVVPRGLALVLAMLLLAGSTTATALVIGWPVALRLLAALGLTLVMINVALNVIGDLRAALIEQTITDPLTGAYNRRHFDVQLARLAPPAPGSEAVNVLLAVDLDHFKAINDSLGHAVGDGVLQRAVAVLNTRKRPSDRLFRTGGEEFVLLLPRISVADAARLAEDLRQRIEAAALLDDRRVTVSIGVAAQQGGRDAPAWLRAADEALYEAKRSGRNRVVVAA